MTPAERAALLVEHAVCEAVAAEREACAKVAEKAKGLFGHDADNALRVVVEAIRARGDGMKPDSGPQPAKKFPGATKEQLSAPRVRPDDVDYPADHFGDGGR
jgi:hypothetical protein